MNGNSFFHINFIHESNNIQILKFLFCETTELRQESETIKKEEKKNVTQNHRK
jgi:hypothetical protein